MPLTIKVPGKELFDPVKGEFIDVKESTLILEHSLLSVTKWESKWHIPYLSRDEKTKEQVMDYIRCMTLNTVDPNIYLALSEENVSEIVNYIQNPMTATTFNKRESKKFSREIITNELIYYWMTALNIPFDPCQKWHLSRLMTLIEVCALKNQPPKNMSKSDVMRQYKSLNAQRRAKYNTKG